jgi:hypothetical protein
VKKISALTLNAAEDLNGMLALMTLKRMASLIPNRLVRSAAAQLGPTKLHYRRLVPNYEKYWVPDSDAINSIDSHEAMLWFLSRGDECLNCQNASMLSASGLSLFAFINRPDN